MKRLLLVLILYSLLVTICNGQIFHRKTTEYNLVVLSPGISYQGQTFAELNLMLSDGEFLPVSTKGPRIGIELNFDENHFIYAPKIGYEVSFFLVAVRGSIISYIDDGKVDLRVLPEVGLSFFNGALIMYGYNIPTLDYRTPDITRHRFTLTVNLDFDVWDEIRWSAF